MPHGHHRWRTLTIGSASAGVVLSAPVAIWWLTDTLAVEPEGSDLDYFVRPLQVGPGVKAAVGAAAVLTFTLGASMLLRARRRGWVNPLLWKPLLPAIMAGVIVGFGYQVMTAGVIGANIGAGMMVLFGGPVVIALLLWSLGWPIFMLVRRPTGARNSSDASPTDRAQ